MSWRTGSSPRGPRLRLENVRCGEKVLSQFRVPTGILPNIPSFYGNGRVCSFVFFNLLLFTDSFEVCFFNFLFEFIVVRYKTTLKMVVF